MRIQDPVIPSVYEAVEPTSEQTTVLDVLLGSLAVVGAVAIVAFVLGLLFAGLMIWLRRARGRDRLNGGGSGSITLGLGDSS